MFYIDSANVKSVKALMDHYAFKGVTTNPRLMAQEKRTDYLHHVKELLDTMGQSPLFIQLNGETSDRMVNEAYYIAKYSDISRLIFKVPVTKTGYETMKILNKRFTLAATGVVSLSQALMAFEAGAKYVIIYVNRMLSSGLNPYDLIEHLSDLKTFKDYDYHLIGASFKSEEEINTSLKSGLDAVTIPPRLAESYFLNPITEKSVKAFQKDFYNRYQVPSFNDKK